MDNLPKPSYFVSVFDNRCPRCRTGRIFKFTNPYNLRNTVKMHANCPVCGQPTEIEVGFYYGTGYVSYAITVGFSVITFIAWWVIFGFSTEDNRFFIWLAINSVLLLLCQPLFMRLSRSLWLSWFVSYDPNWQHNKVEKLDRIIPDQMETPEQK
jgi:uncharacterized protein (DUF983 family)